MKPGLSITSLIAALALGLFSSLPVKPAAAAEYRGQRLDGRSFSAIALSTETQQKKLANVTFNGYQALLEFEDGSYAIVELESVVIEDRDNITALDPRRNVQWKIDLH
jgi:hypothetical protein